MSGPNEPRHKNNVRTGNQPPDFQSKDIMGGYEKRPSGLFVPIQRDVAGFAISKCIAGTDIQEQIDNTDFIELKELLNHQLGEVIDGYGEFTQDLGEEEVSRKDFEATMKTKLEQWSNDGSLTYLQEWLGQNPDRKVYLSAAPNKVLPREQILSAATKFGEPQLSKTFIGKHFYDPDYTDETFCSTPEQDSTGVVLPVSLTVWTGKRNLERSMVPTQQQILAEIQKSVKSAHDPSILQGVGHWYRLRRSEDFGGVGLIGGAVYGATFIRRLGGEFRGDGAGFTNRYTLGSYIETARRRRATFCEFRLSEPLQARFVIG